MSTERSYQEMFTDLGTWMPEIIQSIKKDCRNEHLKGDRGFCRKHLDGKVLHKVGVKDLADAYSQALSDGNEEVGEFIASRWVLRNAEAYRLFEVELQKINPQFDQIKEIKAAEGQSLIDLASRELGAAKAYIFAVLNAVAFSEEQMKALRQAALKEQEVAEAEQENGETPSVAELQKKHERELKRVTDRLEKRLDGLQRKHLAEVTSLKKQVSKLQQRLNNG